MCPLSFACPLVSFSHVKRWNWRTLSFSLSYCGVSLHVLSYHAFLSLSLWSIFTSLLCLYSNTLSPTSVSTFSLFKNSPLLQLGAVVSWTRTTPHSSFLISHTQRTLVSISSSSFSFLTICGASIFYVACMNHLGYCAMLPSTKKSSFFSKFFFCRLWLSGFLSFSFKNQTGCFVNLLVMFVMVLLWYLHFVCMFEDLVHVNLLLVRKCSEALFSFCLSVLMCFDVMSISCYMFRFMCPYFGVASDYFIKFLNL